MALTAEAFSMGSKVPLILEVLTLGLVLSVDSFSAAVAMGSKRFRTKEMLAFAFASGGGEALATLVGFFAGSKIISLISEYDHWFAFTLLLGISLHMAYEGLQGLLGNLLHDCRSLCSSQPRFSALWPFRC